MPPATARPVAGAMASVSGCHTALSSVYLCQAPRRLGQQGEVDVPVFLTQARATPAALQCGTEGLAPSTLIPTVLEQNPPTLRLLTTVRRKNRYPTQDGANAACC